MNEKMQVTLELVTGKFKSALNNVSQASEEFSNKVKNAFNISPAKQYTAQITQLQAKVNDLKATIAEADKGSFKLTKSEVQELNVELEKTQNEIIQLQSKSKGIGGDISKSFTKGLKSVKKLTLGFLGARSAFMLFRKYLGEYQSQNEEFANKMQLTTNVIVNSLAPAFEFFGNVVQYVVIGLARVIEILTGVNILAKTVDNGFKGASKSAKEFNENLSGLDEISNIDQSAGGLSSGIGSQLNALKEFQEKMKEVDAWLKKSGIKKFLEDIKPLVKDVFEWLSEHPLGALGLYGLLKLLKITIPAVLGTPGGTVGLWGLVAVLGALATYGVVKVGVEFSDFTEDIVEQGKAIDSLANAYEHLMNSLPKLTKEVDTPEEISKTFDDASNNVKNDVDTMLDAIHRMQVAKETSKDGGLQSVVDYFNIRNDKKEFDMLDKSMRNYLETMRLLEVQGKLTREQEVEYKNTLLYVKDAMEKTKGVDFSGYLKIINEELEGFDKKNVTATINIDANTHTFETKTESALSRLVRNWKSGISSMFGGKASGGIFTGSWQPITAFAGGGLPDAGQMFVAREAGPELVGTMGGHTAVMNNDQIVASVSSGVYEAVLAAMGGQSDRPIILNVNGKEFAKATYGDYQEEGSRRGANTSIRRV